MEWWILSSFLYSAVAVKVCWNIDPPPKKKKIIILVCDHILLSDQLAKAPKFSQSMPPFDHFLGGQLYNFQLFLSDHFT